MSKLLASKTVFITGGTSALGKRFVRQALEEGARVLFSYYQNDREAKELENLGAAGIQTDLRKPEEVLRLGAEVERLVQRLDAVIHNAAFIADRTIAKMTEQEWDEVIQADLTAPCLLTKRWIPLLKKRRSEIAEGKRSKVYFLTSRAALRGGFGISNYAAAKAALIGLAKTLAAEVGVRGILVNAVNPGFMKSGMTRQLPEEVIEKNLNENPLREYSSPEEVARWLVFLCSDQMSQTTGQVFHFDGRKL